MGVMLWELDELAADCAEDGRYIRDALLSPALDVPGPVGSPINPIATKELLEVVVSLENLEIVCGYTELVNRYGDAVNRRDWDAFGLTFTEAAEWHIGPPLDFAANGRDQIVDLLKSRLAGVDHVIMTIGTVVLLDSDGDRARGRATFSEQGKRTETEGVRMFGLYDDEIVHRDGAWSFTKRTFTMLARDVDSTGLHAVNRFEAGKPALTGSVITEIETL